MPMRGRAARQGEGEMGIVFDGATFDSQDTLLAFLKQAYIVDTTTIHAFKSALDAAAAREAKLCELIERTYVIDSFYGDGEKICKMCAAILPPHTPMCEVGNALKD